MSFPYRPSYQSMFDPRPPSVKRLTVILIIGLRLMTIAMFFGMHGIIGALIATLLPGITELYLVWLTYAKGGGLFNIFSIPLCFVTASLASPLAVKACILIINRPAIVNQLRNLSRFEQGQVYADQEDEPAAD